MGVNVSPDGPYVVIVGPGAVRGWCRVIKASCGVHESFSVTVHSPIRVYSQHKSISNGENSVNIWPWGRPVAKPSVPSQSNLFPRCMADVFTHQAIENIAQPSPPFGGLHPEGDRRKEAATDRRIDQWRPQQHDPQLPLTASRADPVTPTDRMSECASAMAIGGFGGWMGLVRHLWRA